MTDLKEVLEKSGFKNVKTFIQSGNVIFESDEENIGKITAAIQDSLLRTFKLDIPAIVLTRDQFRKVVAAAPTDWPKRQDLRRYIAFIRAPVTVEDVIREIRPKDGVDFLKAGDGVLYLSTLLSGLTKSGFTRLVGTKVYKDITIRNYTTVQKLLKLMEQKGD